MASVVAKSPSSSDDENDDDYVSQARDSGSDVSEDEEEVSDDESPRKRKGIDSAVGSNKRSRQEQDPPEVKKQQVKDSVAALWAEMNAPITAKNPSTTIASTPSSSRTTTPTTPPSSNQVSSLSTSGTKKKSLDELWKEANTEKADTTTYTFAGEVHQAEQTKPSKPGPVRPKFSLMSLANQYNIKPIKMNTLEKSKLDWKGFVSKEGIGDELKRFNKDGYLEKMAFLERVDERRMAELKSGRRSNRKE